MKKKSAMLVPVMKGLSSSADMPKDFEAAIRAKVKAVFEEEFVSYMEKRRTASVKQIPAETSHGLNINVILDRIARLFSLESDPEIARALNADIRNLRMWRHFGRHRLKTKKFSLLERMLCRVPPGDLKYLFHEEFGLPVDRARPIPIKRPARPFLAKEKKAIEFEEPVIERGRSPGINYDVLIQRFKALYHLSAEWEVAAALGIDANLCCSLLHCKRWGGAKRLGKYEAIIIALEADDMDWVFGGNVEMPKRKRPFPYKSWIKNKYPRLAELIARGKNED